MSKRIVVTRSREQAPVLAAQLARAGFAPLLFPVIRLEPLPPGPLYAVLDRIDQFDWLLFTSGNGVDFFFNRVAQRGGPVDLPPVAAVGSATKGKLAERGVSIRFMPEEFTGEQLVSGLGNLQGRRVLLPRARIGRPQIAQMLRDGGATVDDVALYDTVTAVPAPGAIAELVAGFDAITFTSPSSVRNFIKIIDAADSTTSAELHGLLDRSAVVCIGPVTAAEAKRYGLSVQPVPDEYTISAMVKALVGYFERGA